MSGEKTPIDEAELQKARVKAQTGHALILVLENGPVRFFAADEVLGYLSWTAILGRDPERIDLRYGHDLPNGLHTFKADELASLWYRAPNGEEYYSPVAGEVVIEVERPEFGTAFEHNGILLNVRYEKSDGDIVLNGTFRNSSA